ncbi:MAG: putative repeat protein (TIGR04052 family) [Psychrosphaera sp.]|jgi:uncharacterized repeat protein (TIGR04052 family)|uniref:MbnP family copper-binding protein n=1 Tax=uncultured Psychrosphaera sp. TaxID=1403522 RepID=UPI0030F69E2C
MKLSSKTKVSVLSLATVFMLNACSSDMENETSMTEFSLNFTAMSGSEEVSCDTVLSGFGTEGHYSIGVSDLRFYVSNLAFYDQYGAQIEITFNDNDFQLNHDKGFVGLIDLTSNSTGSCASDAIANGEGTARTNKMITGKMLDIGVNKVTFDLGVPQAVMKEVITTQSAEDAPSPLNEMYWSWASGYRHFVMNFAIESMMGSKGEGYLHIGSRGCGDDGGLLALENKERCDFVNTAKVELNNFDPNINQVVIDIDNLLADLAFSASMSGHGSHSATAENDDEMTMDAPSVTCHSTSPDMQADCGPIFNNLGLATEDGSATVSGNKVVTLK